MATKPGRVVTYNEELLSIKSHDPLIRWSSNFDFSYTICRFKTQTPKSSPLSCYKFLSCEVETVTWESEAMLSKLFMYNRL